MRHVLPAALAAVFLAAGLQAAGAGEIRIGITPTTFDAPLLVLKAQNALAAELSAAGKTDVTVRWLSFQAGPPMNEAFAARQLDVTAYGDTPALIGRAAGLKTRAIGVASSGWYSAAAVVRQDSPITSILELKGKKVATQKGTTGHNLLAAILNEAGLTPADIEFVNLPIGELGGVLINGNVDATVAVEPVLTRLEQEHHVRTLRDGKGLKNSIVPLVALDEFARDHGPEITTLLRAYRRAARFIVEHPDEAARLLTTEINQPASIIKGSLAKFNFDPVFQPEHIEAVKSTEAFLREQVLIRAPVDVDAFIDRSYGQTLAAN
jgi:sulfonate transport system substrate-binding protein